MSKSKYITKNEVKGSLFMVISLLVFITPSILFLQEQLMQKILMVVGLFTIVGCAPLGLYLCDKSLDLIYKR